MRKPSYLLAVLSISASPAFCASAAWEEWKHAKDPDAFRVVQFIELGDDKQVVVINGGSEQGLIAGLTLKTYRLAPPQRNPDGTINRELWVETGRLKTTEVQSGATVANVEGTASSLAKALFPKFPGVMAGDFAIAQRVTLARRPIVTPTSELPYYTLFQDPKAGPSSFELTAEGIKKIKEAAEPFIKARVGMLMVEGYTDHHGPSRANQIESYQRALTVRQYLIDELGFDADRVVAIGFGEGEPDDESMVSGHVQANRRIVFKAVVSAKD